MGEFVKGYGLYQHELDLEVGKDADPEKVKEQADLITNNWMVSKTKPERPTLLMLGGFQGSGKTTVLELLRTELGVLIISPDEIRHNLFAQKYPFSDEFVKIVSATKFELIRRALATGQYAAVDQSLTPDRVKLTRQLLEDSPNYRFLSVFLAAPKEVLVKRVTERPQLPGRYRGTVPELEASIDKYTNRYGDPKLAGYDLFIDVTNNQPQAVANLVKARL